MKNEFPLLDALLINGELPPLPPEVKLIEAQEATDKYWFDENDSWSFKKDFGCMSPPYTSMWIESTAHMPLGKPQNGKITGGTRAARIGFKIHCADRKSFEKIYGPQFKTGEMQKMDWHWGYSIQVYADNIVFGSNCMHRAPAIAFLMLDKQGNYVANSLAYEATVTREDAKTLLHHTVWACAKAAFFAISMMNCRNVQVEAKQTIARGGKKTRRARRSAEYHKIHLPTPKASGGNGTGQLSGVTKLHTARGHFKTYTAEAPLMGRHVGTYYWGWQVRGNRKNGEIISSYEVGAA